MIPPLEVWHAHHIAREHAPTPWTGVFRRISALARRLVRVR
jgi:hypothetical protein